MKKVRVFESRAVVVDIAKREQAEAVMEDYQRLFGFAPIGVTLLDMHGRFLDVNDTYCRILGYSHDELLEMSIYDIEAIEKQEETTARIAKIIETGGDRFETRHRCKDGKIVDVEVIVNYISVGGGRMFEFIRDISERISMEEAIKESEEKYSKVFYANPNPMTIVSPDTGHINDVNEAFFQASGYSRDECIGLTITELGLWVSQEDRKKFIRILAEQNKVQDFETEMRLKSGDIKSVLLSVETITIGGESFRVISSKDITDRKKMDEQLIVTDRLASVGELASGIAHELNNPLTGVIGFSDLLMTRENIPEDIKEDLTIINREAVRAAQVAKHLLTFARKHPDEKQPTDINNIVQLVLDLREYEQRVNNIDVEAKLADDLPQILANDFQLQQVFLNIIINAEHFMTEEHGLGTLTIITEQVEDIIRVSITDDGPGIFPDNITHIFDPFYTTKEVGEGTGLGLSICYGVITEHGGKIYAESELGKGTTFTIELPVLKEE